MGTLTCRCPLFCRLSVEAHTYCPISKAEMEIMCLQKHLTRNCLTRCRLKFLPPYWWEEQKKGGAYIDKDACLCSTQLSAILWMKCRSGKIYSPWLFWSLFWVIPARIWFNMLNFAHHLFFFTSTNNIRSYGNDVLYPYLSVRISRFTHLWNTIQNPWGASFLKS